MIASCKNYKLLVTSQTTSKSTSKRFVRVPWMWTRSVMVLVRLSPKLHVDWYFIVLWLVRNFVTCFQSGKIYVCGPSDAVDHSKTTLLFPNLDPKSQIWDLRIRSGPVWWLRSIRNGHRGHLESKYFEKKRKYFEKNVFFVFFSKNMFGKFFVLPVVDLLGDSLLIFCTVICWIFSSRWLRRPCSAGTF